MAQIAANWHHWAPAGQGVWGGGACPAPGQPLLPFSGGHGVAEDSPLSSHSLILENRRLALMLHFPSVLVTYFMGRAGTRFVIFEALTLTVAPKGFPAVCLGCWD